MTDCENVLESVVFGETLAIIILLIAVLFISLSPAVTAFYKHTTGERVNQQKSFSMQGRLVGPTYNFIKDWTVFSTYHPSYINRDKDNLIYAVESHIGMVSRWLDGIVPSAPTPNIVPVAPPKE